MRQERHDSRFAAGPSGAKVSILIWAGLLLLNPVQGIALDNAGSIPVSSGGGFPWQLEFEPGELVVDHGSSIPTTDTDRDGVTDLLDNCTLVPNPSQLDAGADGYGNACDADLDNDGTVEIVDDILTLFVPCMLIDPPAQGECAAADFNGDGEVSMADLYPTAADSLNGPPGPSTADNPPWILPTSPKHGRFIDPEDLDAILDVRGLVPNVPLADLEVRVDGKPATTEAQSRYRSSIATNAGALFQPILVEATRRSTGATSRARVVVIYGDSVANGTLAPGTLNARIHPRGFEVLESVLYEELLPFIDGVDRPGDEDDTPSLPEVLVAEPIPVGDCYVWLIPGKSCLVSLRKIDIQEVELDPFALEDLSVVATPILIEVSAIVRNLSLRYNADINNAGDCSGHMTADAVQIRGYLQFSPYYLDPSTVDTHVIDVQVGTAGFHHDLFQSVDSPYCNLIDYHARFRSAIVDALKNTGDGLLEKKLDEAFQRLELAGELDQLGAELQFEFASIDEGLVGIAAELDGSVLTTTQSPDAPALRFGSFAVPAALPDLSLWDQAPGGGAYDVAASITPTGLNQLLAAATRSAALNIDVTTLDGDDEPNPEPILTRKDLFLLGGVFFLDASEEEDKRPIQLNFRPSLAPFVTGEAGPDCEQLDVRVPGLVVEFVAADGDQELLFSFGLDVRAGIDLQVDSFGRVGATFNSATVENFELLENPAGIFEEVIPFALNSLEDSLFGPLASGQLRTVLATVPLPSFRGLGVKPLVHSVAPGGAIQLFAELFEVSDEFLAPSGVFVEGVSSGVVGGGSSFDIGIDFGVSGDLVFDPDLHPACGGDPLPSGSSIPIMGGAGPVAVDPGPAPAPTPSADVFTGVLGVATFTLAP